MYVTSNDIPFGLMSGVYIFNQPISDEPIKSLGIKSEYIIYLIVTVLHMIKQSNEWHDPKWDVVKC